MAVTSSLSSPGWAVCKACCFRTLPLLDRESGHCAAEVRCRDELIHSAGYVDAEQPLLDHAGTLAQQLSISEWHATHIQQIVERAVAPPLQCAWDALSEVENGEETTYVPGTPCEDEEPLEKGRPVSKTSSDRVSTGVVELDACLDGGFMRGMISELGGESASGKTQLALYTATCTALGLPAEKGATTSSSSCVLQGGRGEGVILLTTKGQTAARHMVDRMVEMTQACVRAWHEEQPWATVTQTEAVNVMLQNVHVACTSTFDAAEHVLRYTLPGLVARRASMQAPPFALVVLDSVPPLLQDDSLDTTQGSSAMARSVRAGRLHALGLWLKQVAVGRAPHTPAMAVITINHVHDAFAYEAALVRQALAQGTLPMSEAGMARSMPMSTLIDDETPLMLPMQAAHFSGLLASVPCAEHSATMASFHADTDIKMAQLGLVWANCINARYWVAMLPPPPPSMLAPAVPVRRLRVVFAPTCTSSTKEALFLVTPRGVQGYVT